MQVNKQQITLGRLWIGRLLLLTLLFLVSNIFFLPGQTNAFHSDYGPDFTGSLVVDDQPVPSTPDPFTTLTTTNRTIDITHINTTAATVHIVEHLSNPSPGLQNFSLPSMMNSLSVQADGVPLSFSYVEGQDSPATIVQLTIPPGTIDLKFEYDQLDGTMAFEDLWYLALYDWVWGPATIDVHLPADATILRYDTAYANVLNPQTIQYNIPSGVPYTFTVVYDTTVVPNLYYTVLSEHFSISLPQLYAVYAPLVQTSLEYFYERYGDYMGYDLNMEIGQSHFSFYFPPGGWHWWGSDIPLWGGLCIVGGGPCAVNRSLLPAIRLGPDTTYWTSPFGYIGHELGHGWQGIISQGNLPWWANEGEGYPSFLFHMAAADVGLCPISENSYESAYEKYLDYLSNPSDNRSYAHIVLYTNLQVDYGWVWLQDIHAAIQEGSLNLSGLSEQAKTDQMILFLSESVGEDLTPYFDQSLIYASQWVRDALASLPSSTATIRTYYTCLPVTAYVEPSTVEWTAIVNSTHSLSDLIQLRNHTFREMAWSVSQQPVTEWLTMDVDNGVLPTDSEVEVELTGQAAGLLPGTYQTTLKFVTQSDIGSSSTNVVVLLNVRESSEVFVPLVIQNAGSPSSVTVSVSIQADEQDGYQDLASFHLAGDGYHNNWVGLDSQVMTGWIFPNVPLPENALLVDAYVRFRGYGINGVATTRIAGFAEDDAPFFAANGSNQPSTRLNTVANISWTNNWSFAWQWWQTPNLTPIIQEIVNRPGWVTGNNVGLAVSNPSGSGTNWAVPDFAAGPYDGSGGGGHSVTLHLTYITP